MTDTRATEWLLDFIAEQAAEIDTWIGSGEHEAVERPGNAAVAISMAVGELVRRGDTLVRREDLRLVLGASDLELQVDPATEIEAARERLDNALGGAF